MSISQYSPGCVHARNVRMQTALRSRISALASDTMHDVHVPLGDIVQIQTLCYFISLFMPHCGLTCPLAHSDVFFREPPLGGGECAELWPIFFLLCAR
jgi:hypothetical protein